MALQDEDPVEVTRRRLMQSLRTGAPQNPDQLAQDRADAARRGVSVQALRAARDQGLTLPNENWHALPERAPATSNFLSDPRNAAVAHDDIENLSGVERIVGRGFYSPEEARQRMAQTAARNARDQGQSAARTPFGRFIERQGPAGRAVANTFRGIGEAGIRLGGMASRLDQTLFGDAEDFMRRQYDRAGIPIYDFRPDDQGRFSLQRVQTAADGTTRTNEFTRSLETPALGYEAGTTWEEVKARPIQNVIPFAIESGLVSLPDMAAAVISAPAYAALRTADIGQSRAENDGREDATVGDLFAALPAATASALLERLGTQGILGIGDELLQGGVRGVASAAGRAGVQEGITEALQGGVEYAGTNLGTQAGFDPVTALDQMAAGAVAGTPFGATVRAVTATGEIVTGRLAERQAEAAAAEQAAQTFQDLTDLSAASRLREREPATFQQFVEQATENGSAENIYVDAQTFAQSLNDAGVSIEEVTAAIPSLADQLPNAIATGGDVRITTGEFAAHLATTDATAALLPHMRTDPFAMSQAQAKEFMATRGDALQAEVEAAVTQATATEELRAGRERLQTHITEELNAAGRFTKDVNAAYATLPATFYDVMAARTGMTAEQLAEKYQLRYAAELPTSTGRRVMEQEDTVDLIHFSDSADLMMSDPKKWGASRATPNSERERRNAGAPSRTYFGVRNVYSGEPATGIARRPFRYQARIPASKLYDFDADPQGLKPTEGTAMEIATAYEKAIQAAGFSGYRSDAMIPGAVAVFDAVELTPASASTFAQSASLRDGRETLQKYGLNPNKRYSTRQVAAALEARQRAKYGSISAKDRSPEAAKKIAKWMAEEVQFELQNPEQSGVGWYSTKFQAALDIFAQKFPELATDKDARDTFTALIAITSDGQKVVPNFQQAAGIYRAFKTDGRFVADRGTQRQASVDQNLAKVQELYDTLGPAGMRETLLQELTVSDLKKKAAALGVQFSTSYKADVKLPLAAVIFGPKLGAFYANLMGADGYLTMDRWWSRTFNRYRGTLLQKPTAQGMARFRELLGQPNLSDDETLAATVGPRNAYAARGYKNPSEIEAAANTLYKAAFENIEDQPFNASDRSFMLDTVARARATLKRQGVEISVADIQAVLWYYEKRLYGELGARQTADVSYEEATQRVVAEGTAADGALGPDLGGDWEAAAEQSDPGALAYNQGPLARSVDAYFSPENIGSLLEKDDWTILTAENPMGQQATPEENAAAQAKLVADLDALGVDYQPSIGRYGQLENSFVIVGITEKQARDLGQKYNQDSVLTRKGLIYQDGRVDAAVGLTVHDTRPEDYFTEVPGTGALFTVDLDFSRANITKGAAFKDWFGDSVVKDINGEPLVVYRGQHSGSADPETRLGSFTFSSAQAASLYAEQPNNRAEEARAPFVIPAYLSIQKPIVNDPTDPYIDLSVLVDGIGFDATAALAKREAARIEQTNAWEEGFAGEFRDVEDVIARAPERLGELPLLAFAALDDRATLAALKAAGFDGAVHGGVGQTFESPEYRVFDEAQIKSVNNRGSFDANQTNILFQADPFYSALERAVADSPLTKAPAAQWMATLSKTPGVKKEEIEITGLQDYLDGLAGQTDEFKAASSQVDAKGNITKDAVLGFVRANGVRLEETVLTGDLRIQEYEGEDGETEYEITDLEGNARASYGSYAEAETALDAQGSQFSDYKLPGADDTYREILLSLPDVEGPSTHWDKQNVVAHARITGREDAAGKRVLFIEELQSDWHQKGRDQGYQAPADPATLAAAQEAYNTALEAQRASWPPTVVAALRTLEQHKAKFADRSDVVEATQRSIDDLLDRDNRNPSSAAIYGYNILNSHSPDIDADAEAAMNLYSSTRLAGTEARIALDTLQGQGIPDAPWKKSWDALLMKRMIRYAVDNGFEQIAWINGNQQNGGQTGGDGSFFYERNLVNVTNDLLKKFGTKVGKVDFREQGEATFSERQNRAVDRINAGEEMIGEPTQDEVMALRARPATSLGVQNGFEITPQLAEAARKGFALFQPNRGQIAFGQDITQTPSVISLLRAADLSTFIHETGHFFLEATADMANATDAPADIVADMATVLNWMRPGMTLADWNVMSLEERRPFHEKWARGFEAYHFEGRSPSLALRDVFRRFSAWLKNVYKSLTALDVELTDEVRQVMDRMLATEAEITEMEQARGLTPAFTNKPEFASDDEWEEYQRLAGDATAEAIEQLEQRSARDMRWASGAKDRYLRSLQREGEEQRKAVRAEVTAEVMAEPVNRARAFLRRGLNENGEPVEGAAKLDLATLKSLYGDEGTWTGLRRGGKYGEVSTDGLHPDAVASMFGYTNGQALIEDMVNGEDSADKIKGVTDQRMLERYGDLSDAQSIERAANEAVANEARAKFVAAEMAMADKAIGKKSILNSAAKEFAASVVNRLELKRLRPAQYLAAQGRAAKAAEKALKGDDLPSFATAKRNQLVNLHTGRAVQQAQKDVEKTMRLFTRIVSAKDDSISKSRNMDLVNAARAVLSSYGVGRVKNDPAGYMRALSQYDPTLYADIEPFVNGARGDAKPIVDLTYEQFTALRDTVNQLWVLSRRTKQIEIDGKLMDREVVTTELGLRLDEIGIPAQAGVDRAPTDRDNRVRDLLGARAALRRVESWARGTDGANSGPFRKYIWNPISVAADAYRAESGVYIRRFRELLDGMRAELKPVDIKAPEIGYTFGGKSELFHALLHTGNGSNKSKLLLGRNWGKKNADGSLDDTRWQSFIDRLHTEGVLTQKDWTFVQAVWDLLEETKPGAQKAHRAIYGRYFDEVSADPVDTPFGQLRGGYVPAMTDGFLVQDAVLRAEQEAIEGGDSAMFPAASNGFTKSRVEDYTRELALDLRLLPMHIDKVLKFTHLGPPVRDVARILKDRGFSKKLQAYDPTAQTDLLLPWLQRAAKQLVETPSKGRAGKAADRFFSAVRSRVGMQLMFANVVNTAQQVTGFSNVLLRVDAPILGDALWRYVRDPKGVAEAAASQSVFLANRMSSDIFEARQTIAQLTKLDPSKTDEAVAFLQRNAYFMQSAVQNVMDVISWTAAFNQASGKGESDRDAARFADSVIRETQGTMAPEDVSRFETGPAFIRVFTQFAGYFNMMANLNATEVQLVARDAGLKKGMGRLFYVYLMGFAVPALIGDAIAKALRGGWEDEEGDGYLDDMFAWFFSSQAKFALAAVPVVGQAANAALGAFTKLPYDDRISMSPAVSVIESGLGTPAEVYQSLVDGESFNRADTRDALNLLGVLTGTPIGALAKPLGYGVGVAQGDIEPTGPLDAARGVVTGAPSPESRMQ
jgi:hypothetical protein